MKIFLIFFLIFSLGFAQVCGPDFINADNYFKIYRSTILKYDRKGLKRQAELYLNTKVDKLEIFFASGLWVAEKERFLAVTRIDASNKNFLWVSYFDKDWNHIIRNEEFQQSHLPAILPIPVENYGISAGSGPQDPRLFRGPADSLQMVINMFDSDLRRKVYLYDLDNHQMNKLTIAAYPVIKEGNQEILQVPWNEKNWAPLIIDSNFYFLYNFNNLQIIDCNSKSVCTHISGKFTDEMGKLKPGTEFIRYQKTDYYFSFAFKHVYCSRHRNPNRFYRPFFAVLYRNTYKNFNNVYNSEPIYLFDKLAYEPYTRMKMPERYEKLDLCEKKRIVVISSIAKFDHSNDEIELLGYFEDNFPFSAKIGGVSDLMSKVIETNESKFYRLVYKFE